MSLAESMDTRGAEPSDNKLTDTEFEIGRKYMGRLPWEMVAWGLGNFVVWKDGDTCAAELRPVPGRDAIAPPPPGEPSTEFDAAVPADAAE